MILLVATKLRRSHFPGKFQIIYILFQCSFACSKALFLVVV